MILNLNDFKKHIGFTIYRTKINNCKCDNCLKAYHKGIYIEDELHAMYLNDVKNSENIRYFATKIERDEYEKSMG
jgi:hypothetical protein